MREHPYLGQLKPGWKAVRLDCVVRPGRPIVYGIVQAGPHVPNGVPYIKSTDVGGTIDLQALARTSPAIHKRYRRAEVRPGDLVFSLRGDIGQSSIVPSTLAVANLTQGTARISVDERYDVSFVRFALTCPSVRKRIAAIAKGSSFQEISLEQLRQLEIACPSLEAQRSIVKILTAWDEAIERTERLLAAKTVLLRVAYQKFFGSGHGAHQRTDLVPLSDLFTRVRTADDGRGHPVLTISGKTGFLRQDERFGRFMAGKSVESYTLLRRGEFSYNKGNSKTYPQGCVYRLEDESGLVPHVYISFRLATNKLDSRYFTHLCRSGFLNHQLYRLINSGVRNNGLLNITPEEFFTCKVPVPPLRKQEIIACTCHEMDREFAIIKGQRDALVKQKRGLMQKLLTGEWSVSARKSREAAE